MSETELVLLLQDAQEMTGLDQGVQEKEDPNKMGPQKKMKIVM